MVKTQELYLVLPRHDEPDVVLYSRSFDFFIIGLTQLVSAPPALDRLVGKQFSSFSRAAAEVFALLKGTGERAEHGHYMHEYHVFCRTSLASSAIGTDELPFVSRRGQKIWQKFSPALATSYVEFTRGDGTQAGMCFPVGELMPFVPIGMNDDDVADRLAREVSSPCPPQLARVLLRSLDLPPSHPFFLSPGTGAQAAGGLRRMPHRAVCRQGEGQRHPLLC